MGEEDIGVGKNVLKSKTVWVNILSLVLFVAAYFGGFTLTTEQYAVLVPMYFFFINLILRVVTKEPIVWS